MRPSKIYHTYFLHDKSDPGPLIPLGCGTVSRALEATCVYPLQVIRTRGAGRGPVTLENWYGGGDRREQGLIGKAESRHHAYWAKSGIDGAGKGAEESAPLYL